MEIRVLGSGQEVGRAAIYLKGANSGLLLDYGVNFDEKDNPQLPMHVRPVDISAVVISHAHLDHVGAAPYLYITGGPRAISTKPTMDIAKYLTVDFLRLNAHYIDYELREFDRMYSNTIFLNFGEEAIVGEFKVRLYSSGHILGSSMVYAESETGDRVLYTSDFNTAQTWTLGGAETPPIEPSTLIVESTYGGRNHPPRHLVEKRLLEVVEETIDRGGVILVPAFSVGRTQEVMTLLGSQAPYLDIYVDGMSRDISELYLKHKRFLRDPNLFSKVVENVNFVTDVSMRKKILKKPCAIIASAGMLKGGPALYYLKQIHSNSRNAVVLVSYQSANSNGHKILSAGSLQELGVGPIKARLEWLSLSSHGSRDDIIRFARHYKGSVKDIIIVHGSSQDSNSLSLKLREALGDDVNIYVPANGEVIKAEN
ncbi:MAG: MBL fold metallo-hydrolase [Desulfurococcaceae archaeon]